MGRLEPIARDAHHDEVGELVLAASASIHDVPALVVRLVDLVMADLAGLVVTLPDTLAESLPGSRLKGPVDPNHDHPGMVVGMVLVVCTEHETG